MTPHNASPFPPRAAAQLYDFFFGTEARTSASIFAFVLLLGVALGVALPPDDYPEPYGRVSGVLGWVYFSAWSVSFWPQVLLNYRRRSVAGLSFDYVSLNLVGFSCYTAYNVAYYYNPDIRAAYVAEYGSLPAVQANDVFFALHAVALTAVCCVQIGLYDRGGQRISRLCLAILAALGLAIFGAALLVAFKAGAWFTWLHYLLYLSYVKLAITLMKYLPQVVLNCRRRSTAGWT
jgi:cystinosin